VHRDEVGVQMLELLLQCLRRVARDEQLVGVSAGLAADVVLLAGLLFVHVIVTDLHRYGTNCFAIAPHLAHEVIGHAPQRGFEKRLIRRVSSKSFLLAIGLGRRPGGHYRTFIDAKRKST